MSATGTGGRLTAGRVGAGRRSDSRSPPPLAWSSAPFLLYAVAFLVVPVGILAVYSVWTAEFFEVSQTFTLDNYREVLSGSLYPPLLVKSLGIGLLAATIMVAGGFVMAYAITFRFRRLGTPLLVLVVATLLASYLARIYAWGTILGTNGIVNRALTGLGLIDEPLTFLFYGYFAITVTLVYVYLPIAALIIYGSLQNIDPRTLEASRDMGAGRWSTLARVVVPQALPGITSAFALTFVLAATDYVTPSLVGGARGQMIGAVIRDQFGGAANLPRGAALAFVAMAALAVVVLVVTLLVRVPRLLGRGERSTGLRLPRPALPERFSAASSRISFSAPATVLLIGFLLAPLVIVILFSFNEGRIAGLPLTGLSTRWYSDVVAREEFGRVLTTSLSVMAIAVAGGLLLAVPTAFALARRRFRLRPLLNGAVYGPVAVPGVVLGVALLTTLTYINVRLGLFPTALAHVLLVTPFIVVVVRARLLEMDPRIGEAARDLGASPRRVLSTITLPLVAPSLLGAAVLAAAVSLDEILVTNFTIGTDATLPVWILSQMRRGLNPGINALAVMILVGTLVLIAVAALLLRARSLRLRRRLEPQG